MMDFGKRTLRVLTDGIAKSASCIIWLYFLLRPWLPLRPVILSSPAFQSYLVSSLYHRYTSNLQNAVLARFEL
jgi:hypothetical protein